MFFTGLIDKKYGMDIHRYILFRMMTLVRSSPRDLQTGMRERDLFAFPCPHC